MEMVREVREIVRDKMVKSKYLKYKSGKGKPFV